MTYKFTPTRYLGADETPPLLTDLLAMDAQARRYGCGLNPRLRALLEDAAAPEFDIVEPPRP